MTIASMGPPTCGCNVSPLLALTKDPLKPPEAGLFGARSPPKHGETMHLTRTRPGNCAMQIQCIG